MHSVYYYKNNVNIKNTLYIYIYIITSNFDLFFQTEFTLIKIYRLMLYDNNNNNIVINY